MIEPIGSRAEYSAFVLKSLARHIDTPFVLLIQWDGYVVNPAAWREEFLACDYIGAKWFWHSDGMRVGNGGFSLRSRKLLAALQDPRIVLTDAEDVTIGRAYRPLLEREYSILFAPESLADAFCQQVCLLGRVGDALAEMCFGFWLGCRFHRDVLSAAPPSAMIASPR